MKDLIEQLLTLQDIELGPSTDSAETEAAIARLRQKIPVQILGHYDRLMARGRKGVSIVRNGVCSECHMRLASGTYAQLLRHEDVIICDSCGRYLHAVAEAPPEASEPALSVEPVAPAKKPKRKRAAKVA